MDRMHPGLWSRIYGCLVGALFVWLLVACTPITDRGMAPLFPTRIPVSPSSTHTTPPATPVPATPTALPKPARTIYPLAPATLDAQARAWLDRAALPVEVAPGENWDAIQRAARAEGQVVLYSDTARMLTALESFLLVNPGYDGEVRVTSSDEAFLELMQSTADETPWGADVYLGGDGPLVMQALAQNRVVNYVPADLRQALPASMQEPLLVHHWSAVILVQRGASAIPSPVDSWWDLTREEWRGRVALSDPAIDKRSMYLLLAFAQHGQDLAAAYRVEFGRELTLDEGCPDAGCQWIKMLLRNKPRLLAGDAEVAAWVGDPGTAEARLGICGSEQLAKAQRGKISLSALSQVAPAAGLFWPTYLAMVVGGPHPNAAKVLIHWLMSDAVGDAASAPWYEAGHYFPRADIPEVPGTIPRGELDPLLWRLDPSFVLEHTGTVSDWIEQAR